MRLKPANPRDRIVAFGIGSVITIPAAFVTALIVAAVHGRMSAVSFWAIVMLAYFVWSFVVESRIIRHRERSRKR